MCPVCIGKIYIVTTGDMPPGSMTVTNHPPGRLRLEGMGREVGTIQIDYNIPSGVQGPLNPDPGSRFIGASRTAYLPDTAEGREVLQLLRTCWDRRLTFTVGSSVTLGPQGGNNRVTWNGVHHKTSPSGGTARFGYPDETYLFRVKEELKAKGIEPPK